RLAAVPGKPISESMSVKTHPAADGEPAGEAAGKGFVAQVVGNTSLLAAVLVYMGWAYENSLLEHFHVSAFSLGIGTTEYVLKGLVPLFRSTIVYLAALTVAVLALAPYGMKVAKRLAPRTVRGAFGLLSAEHQVMLAGMLLVVVALPLAWSGQSADSPG